MGMLVVSCAKDEDIGTVFLKAVDGARSAHPAPLVCLPLDLAHDLAEYIQELIEKNKDKDDRLDRLGADAKPRFFQLAGHYVQVAAIATVLQSPNGDVAMITVNNGVINIDAFTWASMREAFESVIDLKVIKVSSLVKGAS